MKHKEQYRKINIALRQNGFRADATRTLDPTWNGTLRVAGKDIAVSVIIPCYNFVKIPIVRLLDLSALPARNHPHIDPTNGDLCYVNKHSVVLDRYMPGEMVLSCLKIAAEVLDDIVYGKLDKDFPDEFAAYWQASQIFTDLPEDFSGDAILYSIALSGENRKTLLCTDRKKFTPWHIERGIRKYQKKLMPVLKLSTDMLVPKNGAWPPQTLADVIQWLYVMHPALKASFIKAVKASRELQRLVAIHAANGFFVIGTEVPSKWQTEEFLKSRSGSLNRLLLSQKHEVEVQRYFGTRIDREYLYQRNLGKMSGLKDKSILLIGCGTIGGALSQMLVQSGAGSNPAKRFTIVDNETLSASNIGRHMLGMSYVGLNKAEACCDFLAEQHPEAKVVVISDDIMDALNLLNSHDLVIDATGEEALSYALNETLIKKGEHAPSIIYVWLEGNGAAGRGLYCEVGKGACRKCLHPNPATLQRFPILRNNVEVETVQTFSCGDNTYIPFPVSRSVQAAGLGLDMVLDYVNGNSKPNFRNRRYDHRATLNLKDSNPAPSDKCRACQTTLVSATQ